MTRGDLETEYVVFVPPDYPGDMRLLTLAQSRVANRSACASRRSSILRSRTAPTRASTRLSTRSVGSTLLFQNPHNDFVRGFAFAATSLEGAGDRDHPRALLRRAGTQYPHPRDGRDRRERRRRARRRTARRRLLQARSCCRRGLRQRSRSPSARRRAGREALAAAARVGVASAEDELAATRASWAERLGKVEVRTNRPDFDRLVNTWLPYQLYASRLFGRVGSEPARRRDRLSRPVAGRAAADAPRAAADAGADRAAREPAVPRRRRAQMVASRARRRDRSRPADQGERSAPLAALRARPLRARQRRSDGAR